MVRGAASTISQGHEINRSGYRGEFPSPLLTHCIGTCSAPRGGLYARTWPWGRPSYPVSRGELSNPSGTSEDSSALSLDTNR